MFVVGDLVLLLLVEGLLRLLGPRQTHLRVLSGHATLESAVELGAQSKLLEDGGLLLVQDNTLLLQSLVLHAVEALLDGRDLGGGGVRGPDSRGIGRGHAVGAETNGRVGLRVENVSEQTRGEAHRFVRVLLLSIHTEGAMMGRADSREVGMMIDLVVEKKVETESGSFE